MKHADRHPRHHQPPLHISYVSFEAPHWSLSLTPAVRRARRQHSEQPEASRADSYLSVFPTFRNNRRRHHKRKSRKRIPPFLELVGIEDPFVHLWEVSGSGEHPNIMASVRDSALAKRHTHQTTLECYLSPGCTSNDLTPFFPCLRLGRNTPFFFQPTPAPDSRPSCVPVSVSVCVAKVRCTSWRLGHGRSSWCRTL